jgi:hypothetical protein
MTAPTSTLVPALQASDIPLEPVWENADGSMMAPSLNYKEKRTDWQVGAWQAARPHGPGERLVLPCLPVVRVLTAVPAGAWLLLVLGVRAQRRPACQHAGAVHARVRITHDILLPCRCTAACHRPPSPLAVQKYIDQKVSCRGSLARA